MSDRSSRFQTKNTQYLRERERERIRRERCDLVNLREQRAESGERGERERENTEKKM